MKKLTLIRHAKSDWHSAAETDFDRPLNGRGKKAAALMGQRLAERGCSPHLILSSPARRAYETAETIAKLLDYPITEITFDRSIYEASLKTLIKLVRELDDELENAILVGHNPGFSELGEWLSDDAPEWLPTCGLLDLELAISDWAEAAEDCGIVSGYDYPKKKI